MRKVLDANCFQAPELEVYLRASSSNFVVFTDYACMEAYGGDSLVSIRKSLEIVSRHPKQVEVLKSTRDIVQLQGPLTQASISLLTDTESTRGFGLFCAAVELASKGNEGLIQQVLAHGNAAMGHFDAMLREAEGFPETVELVRDGLRPEHVDALRKRTALSAEACNDTIQRVLQLAAAFYRMHPDQPQLPKDIGALCRTYIFRYALAAFLLVARWIGQGGVYDAKPHKLRNDHVDATYVAYATLFDGLLSKDRKMLELYEEARFLLDAVFLRL
jgi:hypothetical protein